jgi:hypothetical protein
MKFVVIALVSLTLLGCSAETGQLSPTAPGPTTNPNPTVPIPTVATIWVMAVENSGVCIVAATAEVVRGERAGQKFTQNTPCNVWGYDGGFVLKDLTSGVELTLHFSAPGYVDKEVTVVPHASRGLTVTAIALSRNAQTPG